MSTMPRRRDQKKRTLKPFGWALAAFVIAVLFLIWLLLGSFRFMFTRYASFTGFPFTKRNTMVLIQDNTQLQPTGGSIIALGEWKFSHGINGGISLQPATDFAVQAESHPMLVMRALLGESDYSLDQANVDPDLAAAQEAIAPFYQDAHPDARIDGLITLDLTALEALLETDSTDPDEIARALNREIRRAVWMPWRTTAFTKVLAQQFDEKHIQAHFNKNGLNKAFSKRGWSGQLLTETTGDTLAISEANTSSQSNSPVVLRDVQYELDVLEENDVLGNPVIMATLTVRHSHEGSSGTHSAYLRSLIPLASDVQTPYAVDEERDDFQVIGEMVSLEPGESFTYTYEYELPEYVWDGDLYTLNLIKQPGTAADHTRVIVRVPEGMSIDSQDFKTHQNVGLFETQLLTDTRLSFQLMPDADAPELLTAEITALNEVQLTFNEPLGANAVDPSRYRIAGLTVLSASVDQNTVTLTSEGMEATESPVDYSLTIRDLTDRAGNLLTPNPSEISLTQMPGETELAPDPEDEDNEALTEPEPET